jgi:hypothetical protein
MNECRGKVYFCSIGRQYWRLTEQMSDFLKAPGLPMNTKPPRLPHHQSKRHIL